MPNLPNKIILSSGCEVEFNSKDLFDDLDHLIGACVGETQCSYRSAKGVDNLSLLHEEFAVVVDQFGNNPEELKAIIVLLFEYCVRNKIKWGLKKSGKKKKEKEDVIQYYTSFLILFRLFDGNVDRWIDWIQNNGSDGHRLNDLPIAFHIKKEAEKDSGLLERARKMIEEKGTP